MAGTVYRIHENALSHLRSKIAKIARRAEKLGLSGVGITLGVVDGAVKSDWLEKQFPDTPLSEIPLMVETKDSEGRKVYERYLLVTLTGKTPVIETTNADGDIVRWMLAAVIQHTEHGNIIRRFPDLPEDVEIGAEWRTAEPNCAHCGKIRKRRDTFLLYSQTEGLIQVGRDCMGDFTGVYSPEHYMKLAGYIRSLEDTIRENSEYGFGGGNPHFETVEYLAYVAFCLRKYGWVSRREAMPEAGKPATADDAWNLFTMPSQYRKSYEMPEKQDSELAEKALEWITTVLKEQNSHSDLEWNLVVAAQPFMTYRERGILAYGVVMYQKAMAEAIEQEFRTESNTESQYVGEVGNRQDFTVTVEAIISFDGAYGVTYLHKFRDNSGNLMVWFTSSDMLEQGCTYTGKATVKDHQEYNGEKQTIITRCKFEKVEKELNA